MSVPAYKPPVPVVSYTKVLMGNEGKSPSNSVQSSPRSVDFHTL